MPVGYSEACYGGDFSKNLAGMHPIYSAGLDIPQSSWPQLKNVLIQVAARYKVKSFADIRNTNQLKMFSVSLCSEDGLFSTFDKRTWYFPNEKPIGLPAIQINIYAYKNDERWPRLATDLDKALRRQWPKELQARSVEDSRLLNTIL